MICWKGKARKATESRLCLYTHIAEADAWSKMIVKIMNFAVPYEQLLHHNGYCRIGHVLCSAELR